MTKSDSKIWYIHFLSRQWTMSKENTPISQNSEG